MYIQLNSQIICYEKTGEGSPVILIHGNREDHHIFDKLVETMEKEHTVYAVDLRGHGESATPKNYHYKDMAQDIINLIGALEIPKPYLLGFSDGAIVSLIVAMGRSDLISGVISCGANLTPDGIKHRDMRAIKKEFKETGDPRVALMMNEPDIKELDLKKISVPVLVVAGENDMIKEKETEKIVRGIRMSTKLILSDENHGSYIYGTDKLYQYIRTFFK